MTARFDNGYALLIAVNESAVPEWALPAVEQDVDALHRVLIHPERCAYRPEHVRVIKGQEATRGGILAGLDWLQREIAADASGNATAVLHYSGHGWRDAAGPPGYFLIPYDVRADRLRSTALRAEDFAEAVDAVQPQRLLTVLDCCHAGGMGVKAPSPTQRFTPSALPPDLLLPAAQAAKAIGDEGLNRLRAGTGRAVLTSSSGEQSSYLRADGRMSIFTYHLIEALTGHAQPQGGATEVLVSDVLSHVYRRVPATARAEHGAEQQPDGRLTGNFAVALLLGGKGLAQGTAAPDPLADSGIHPPPGPGATTIHVTGSGAAAAHGGVAAGAGGIAVGGDLHGNITLGGDHAAQSPKE